MTDSGDGPTPTDEADTVSVPEAPDSSTPGSVSIVGTAHVSPESVAEVEETIECERPDVVAVELDESRYRQLKGEDPEDLEASDVLSGNTVYQFLAYWLLSYVQTRLGERFDVKPGADMLAGIETAERLGCGVALVDRDIQETVRRLWTGMRLREKLQLLGSLLTVFGGPLAVAMGIGYALGLIVGVASALLGGPYVVPPGLGADVGIPILGGLLGSLLSIADVLLVATGVALVVGVPLAVLFTTARPEEDVEEIDLDELTDADVVTAMIEEFRRFSPGGAEALIDERDAFIAHKLVALRDAGYDVVAVVGAGHREGIERYLANPETLPDPETLRGEPSGSRFGSLVYRAIGYLFTVGFLIFFLLLAMAGVRQTWLLQLFAAWFVVNGVIAMALALVAGAHWTSASVGGAVAWLTSINPLLAPGWFAGYVELRYLRINVADIGRLNELLDDETLSLGELFYEMREVPLFRLILIVGMTNVGSFIASILFVTVFLPWFSAPIGGVPGLANHMIEGARNSLDLIVGVLS